MGSFPVLPDGRRGPSHAPRGLTRCSRCFPGRKRVLSQPRRSPDPSAAQLTGLLVIFRERMCPSEHQPWPWGQVTFGVTPGVLSLCTGPPLASSPQRTVVRTSLPFSAARRDPEQGPGLSGEGEPATPRPSRRSPSSSASASWFSKVKNPILRC